MICRRHLMSYCWNTYFRRSVILGNISYNNVNQKRDWNYINLLNQRGMAGHNKWSNIKHIKMAKDHQKSLLFTKMTQIIKRAIQAGKSNNPKVNDLLANAIEEAKRVQMPVAKIESIIKGSEKDKPLFGYLMELKGPGGCFIIIDILTDNVNRSKQQIKHEINHSGLMVTECNAQHAFNYKGTVDVEPKASGISMDNAIDVAIEVGAEDVAETTSDDGTPVLQFLCEPRDHFLVKTALVNRGCEVMSASLAYLPKHRVTLGETDMNIMQRLCEMLDERPDIVTFYDNVE